MRQGNQRHVTTFVVSVHWARIKDTLMTTRSLMNPSASDLHQLYEQGSDLKFRTVILADVKLSRIVLLVLDVNLTVCT